jgi:hypothetical protein
MMTSTIKYMCYRCFHHHCEMHLTVILRETNQVNALDKDDRGKSDKRVVILVQWHRPMAHRRKNQRDLGSVAPPDGTPP